MPAIFQSLIQSDFGGDHGNFEAVINEGDTLTHWWRDNEVDGLPWKRGQTIVPEGVAGAGAIIQSDFAPDDHGNFEVVVPLQAADGRVELWHFVHDNSDVTLPWQKVQRVTGDADNVAFPAALIQSDFETADHGNLEVVVPLRVADGRVELRHFVRDNRDLTWHQSPLPVADNVTGPGALIQSDFETADHGNLEVVVPLRVADGRVELRHFVRDNRDLTWHQSPLPVADNVTGPGALIQSDFVSGEHGNFEVLVPEGRRLTHFVRDNRDLTWHRGQFVTDSLAGWASLIRSDFPKNQEHKNFEVLIEECDRSVIGYWHPNVDTAAPWLRDKPMIPRGYRDQVRLPDTRKIVQLTGEFDWQGWKLGDPLPPAHNQTESRFGIRGTDLGSSFVHRDRTFFLFGDTARVVHSEEEYEALRNLDSIAFTTDTNPDDGLDLTFLDRPPFIHPPIFPRREFNVPLDGVSVNGSMFVFFSTDSHRWDEAFVMGRSILTRSTNDGFDFDFLYEFSRDKFINVSVERLTLDEVDEEAVGAGTRDVLCVWGSGRYRSSDVYLAILPVAELMTGRGRRFYAGSEGRHVWSSDERDAAPLFCSGDVGELSARWNPFLKRLLLMCNGGSPRGIVLHAASKPWGPWTHEPIMVFDPGHRAPDQTDPCLHDGYGRFMHIPWKERQCDFCYDLLHDDDNEPGHSRDEVGGGEYGPYQIAHMAKGSPDEWTQLYFVMSTWNPYQVVLMTTRLSVDVLGQVERTATQTAVVSRLEIHGKTPF